MLVIETASPALRGELCKWMLEAKPGVFVARMSAVVREALWEKVKHDSAARGALLIYSFPSEIGFRIEMHGEPTRSILDLDGLQLKKVR